MNDTHKTTEYTAAAREYINNMTEDELIEHGHNEFNGKDQMIAALHTIDLLAAHDNEAAEAGRSLLQIIDNNAADNAKLADKLNSVAGAAIDTIVQVMQATDTPNEAKLKAAQTLLKARQDVTDHLLKDEEKKRESSFDPFADHFSL